ncbi:MAG: FkbM family methyltransferase [Prevotellaceae bacterium]|jgi:FkbM family methyltransferase|nr:FkbM family methyltransferase [Prevotellaceae bacterium]
MKKIYERLEMLLDCWSKFGFTTGFILFFKIKLKHLNSIKLPNLEYTFKLRNILEDLQVFKQIFFKDYYDFNYGEPNVIIDGGANIGLFAIQMASKYPNAKIICIEPDHENFELLTQNTSVYKNISCENCGLWDKDTKLRVYDKYNLGKWGMIVEEDEINGTIPAISLNTLMNKYNIEKFDLLKLDIETSEKQLFKKNYQDWLPQVEMLVIELHDRILKGCAQTFFETINEVFLDYDFGVNGDNIIIKNIKIK